MLHFNATIKLQGAEGNASSLSNVQKTESNVYGILRAFFSEFNAQSSLFIKDGQVKLDIVFDEENLPDKIISALEPYSESLEFFYSGKTEENEKSEDTDFQAETESDKPRKSPKHNFNERLKLARSLKITELEEMAKRANSYKKFVSLVGDWIDVGKRKPIFEDMVKIVNQIEEDLKWSDIEKELRKNNPTYKNYDRVAISIAVREKNKDYGIWIIEFLIIMREYKEYNFVNSGDEEEECFSEEDQGNVEKEEVDSKSAQNVEAEATSMVEKIVNKVRQDETVSIEEKVEAVLSCLGLYRLCHSSDTETILSFVTEAVTAKEDDYIDTVAPYSRALMAKFIKDFSEENAQKRMKNDEFISILREGFKV